MTVAAPKRVGKSPSSGGSSLRIPGYRVGQLIAEGGMASVYLAEQKSLARRIAIKVLKNTNNPSFSKRFLDEGRIIAKLNHQNIITIHNIGLVEGQPYISMEYVEGGDLEAKIASGMGASEALELLKVIGGCLDFVHRNGVVHRDIKPANILFRNDGTPLLTDFGIAKRVTKNHNLTMDGSTLGSPYYFSPEQAQGKPVDGRTDIYGLGVIFYEILTGLKPFNGSTPINTIVLHLQQPIPTLPAKFQCYQKLLNRMLAKDINDRFKSAAEMVSAVEDIQKKLRSHKGLKPNASSNKLKPTKKPVKNTGIRQIIYCLTIFAIVVTGHYYFVSPSSRAPLMSIFSLDGDESGSARDPSLVDNESGANLGKAWQVSRYLNSASLSYRQGNFVLPENNNAAYYYKAALELDPSNAEAIRGIQQVVEHYADLTESALQQQDYASAKNYLGFGMQLQPENPRLLRSNAKLTPISKKIEKLLELASERFRKDMLSLPDNDSALFYYKKALVLDAYNRDAKEGLARIGDRYGRMAKESIEDSNYYNAIRYVSRGLSIDPTNKELGELESKVSRFLKRETERLLALASLRYKQKKITRPKNDSALFYYRKVKRLDPKNPKGNHGITTIAERFSGIGEEAAKRLDYEKASEYLKRGLGIQPENRRLLALSSKLKNIDRRLKEYLSKGSQRLAQDRLTMPSHDNALYFFSEVLKLDRDNPSASRGIRKIVKRYASMADKAVDASEYSKARQYVNRGLAIKPANKTLLALDKKITRLDTSHQRFLRRVKNLFR